MLTGMSRVYKNNTGMTLTEVLIATLLLSVVFLAVSSLYLGSRKLYIASTEKVILGYELQYASQHIYKNAMRAIGDEISPPASSAIQVPDAETLNININTNDPLTSDNYSDVITYSYYKSGDTLMFNDGVNPPESLIPKVSVSSVNFEKSGNTLICYVAATYGAQSQTIYFACHPRLATFH
jgi:prepilin-type N-terminal cleavage/methylation domain-containing protein